MPGPGLSHSPTLLGDEITEDLVPETNDMTADSVTVTVESPGLNIMEREEQSNGPDPDPVLL